LSSIQSAADKLVSDFCEQASDWQSLVSVTAGGLAYRWGKIGVIGFNAGTMGGAPLRMASVAFGLGSEVTAFEFTNRFLTTLRATGRSPLQDASRLWSWSGTGGLKEGWLQSFLTFGTLKGFGKLAEAQNLIFQHGIQDLGMVAGHHLLFQVGLRAKKPEGTLQSNSLHAEATNLQPRPAWPWVMRSPGKTPGP
jgi:hypothetical protein